MNVSAWVEGRQITQGGPICPSTCIRGPIRLNLGPLR